MDFQSHVESRTAVRRLDRDNCLICDCKFDVITGMLLKASFRQLLSALYTIEKLSAFLTAYLRLSSFETILICCVLDLSIRDDLCLNVCTSCFGIIILVKSPLVSLMTKLMHSNTFLSLTFNVNVRRRGTTKISL